MIKMIFYFLGSVHLAIFLIATTLIFVIFGTLLESWSGSHLFAAQFTYKNPFFYALLWGYFINILFATLRRFPFQKKQIPFILTHLGLLMILGGTLVKSSFGTQGAMGLTEGEGANHLYLAHTFALSLENREQGALIPIKPGKLCKLPSPFPELQLTLIEWIPHSEEVYQGWIRENVLELVGFPPLPVCEASQIKPSLRAHDYDLYAIKGELADIEGLVSGNRAGIALMQKLDGKQILYAWDTEKHIHTQDLGEDVYMVFDKGYQGYGLYASLPLGFPVHELISPITRRSFEKSPHKKHEELVPRIKLLISDGNEHEIISLSYDPYASRFKWPILNGKYLIRFQADEKNLSSTVRLREGREITYPHTAEPFSYESDLLIDGKEVTISMNHVYENRKGYRFYMANLVSRSPFSAKKVQIVVNRDPAKYWLTYPGGAILALGIILLFLQRRYA